MPRKGARARSNTRGKEKRKPDRQTNKKNDPKGERASNLKQTFE